MLESGGTLQTWELRELPALWAQQCGVEAVTDSNTVPVVRLPDHRLAYLDYEGPLTDDRGDVHRCDSGTYELLVRADSCQHIRLHGALLGSDVQFEQYETNYRVTASSS
ncbi:MAG: hypothetical protein MK171_06140 [Pirellulales bacterium]|nr:hypothetical protein [Pirellulales bacterium]